MTATCPGEATFHGAVGNAKANTALLLLLRQRDSTAVHLPTVNTLVSPRCCCGRCSGGCCRGGTPICTPLHGPHAVSRPSIFPRLAVHQQRSHHVAVALLCSSSLYIRMKTEGCH